MVASLTNRLVWSSGCEVLSHNIPLQMKEHYSTSSNVGFLDCRKCKGFAVVQSSVGGRVLTQELSSCVDIGLDHGTNVVMAVR